MYVTYKCEEDLALLLCEVLFCVRQKTTLFVEHDFYSTMRYRYEQYQERNSLWS